MENDNKTTIKIKNPQKVYEELMKKKLGKKPRKNGKKQFYGLFKIEYPEGSYVVSF